MMWNVCQAAETLFDNYLITIHIICVAIALVKEIILYENVVKACTFFEQ